MKPAYYIGWIMRSLLIYAAVYLSTQAVLDMLGIRWTFVAGVVTLLYYYLSQRLLSIGGTP